MPPHSYTSTSSGDDPADEEISTEGLSFELDGVTFTCHGYFDSQDLAELAAPLLDAKAGWMDPEALGAVATFYRTIMGEDTYRAFARHRRTHRTPASVVSAIMTDMIGELTSRDPQKPSDSPPGLPATGGSSPAGPARPASGESPAQPGSPPHRRTAIDPEGILPPDWAQDAEVITAPAPAAAAAGDPMAGTHRTVNLGDASRTRIDPLYPGLR